MQREAEVSIPGKPVKMHETESSACRAAMASLPHDGSERCQPSSHVEEYFAQVSCCCWLEANGGSDSYTGKPRQNRQGLRNK